MKRILIINGNPKIENIRFNKYCESLRDTLATNGNDVTLINLRDKEIKDCIGCYSCWLKTPGVCALKDDQEEVLKKIVNSDLIILASPIIMGFISADLKKVTDRMIPLVHPFLKIEGDRMAHYSRYGKANKLGLLLEKENYYDEGDIEIIKKIYSNALFVRFLEDNVEEVAHEAYNI